MKKPIFVLVLLIGARAPMLGQGSQVEEPKSQNQTTEEKCPLPDLGSVNVVAPCLLEGNLMSLQVDEQDREYLDGVRVLLQITLNAEGSVREIAVLHGTGDDEVDEKIRDTVLIWKFRPAYLKGRPVAVYFNKSLELGFD